MDESAPIRAIVIGVSTLLAVATISAVLMYYNTAKQMASNVGRGQDFAANYDQSIQDILFTGSYNVTGNSYITGTDVKNLLNYFSNSETMKIKVYNIKVIDEYKNYTPIVSDVSEGYDNANLENYKNAMKNISDNQRFIIESKNDKKITIKGVE